MSAARDLSTLVGGWLRDAPAQPVNDLTIDSRAVVPGALFLALRGRSTHGLAHLDEALARGASAVLYEPAPGLAVPTVPAGFYCRPIEGLSRHAGAIADIFFGAPSRELQVAAITGTNGKTTSAWLLAHALNELHRPSAYMGTIGVGLVDAIESSTHTTQDAVTVQRDLERLRGAGARCVVMEVSSHALDQHRVAGVRFCAAAFTNLTREHLDYHGTMQAYGESKAGLFSWPGLAARVINIDDEFGAELAHRKAQSGRLIVTSRSAVSASRVAFHTALGHDVVRAGRVALTPRGIEMRVASAFGSGDLQLPLIGEFNADNILTVLGLLGALGLHFADAAPVLARCKPPPGRMEAFGGGTRPLVLVDYAHTPDALSQALRAARAHCAGRLVVVFGCGGDRDRGKRPLMGGIAADFADAIFVTDDNPRGEQPERIVNDIVSGMPAGRSAHVVHDRAAAIRAAVESAHGGDVVLIAGKGHEQYQIYGSERRRFSDQSVVRTLFAAGNDEPRRAQA
jgi:UDP-N-acetylmuramoyl-L-alanyl-D-glutamate--2,6-diaminopimelate ligase